MCRPSRLNPECPRACYLDQILTIFVITFYCSFNYLFVAWGDEPPLVQLFITAHATGRARGEMSVAHIGCGGWSGVLWGGYNQLRPPAAPLSAPCTFIHLLVPRCVPRACPTRNICPGTSLRARLWAPPGWLILFAVWGWSVMTFWLRYLGQTTVLFALLVQQV